MNKNVEVEIGIHCPDGVLCVGIGQWSKKNAESRDVREKGSINQVFFAECPVCRKSVRGSSIRELPSLGEQIKELVLRVTQGKQGNTGKI